MTPPTSRVAVFSRRFLPYSQTFIFDELRHHERYEAEVFCLERQNATLFPFPRVHALRPADTFRARAEAALCDRFLYSARFSREVQTGSYDLLHAHFGVGAQWALPIAHQLNLPLVVTLHGFDVGALATRRRFAPKHWRYALLAPWLLRQTTRFLAASTELAELMIGIGAEASKVHVWRLGIELPRQLAEPQDSQTILMVGRMVEKKGFEFGLRAFASASTSWSLTLIGDGELRSDLERLARELGIAERVRFLGALPHEEVLERMNECAVLLAPSVTTTKGDRESGLIVAKEAAARGIPTVGSRHGGIVEIINDGVTGFLVKERDVAGLTDRLVRLQQDASMRKTMGQAARRRMERDYEIGARVRELETHYDQAREEHGRR